MDLRLCVSVPVYLQALKMSVCQRGGWPPLIWLGSLTPEAVAMGPEGVGGSEQNRLSVAVAVGR